MLFTGSGGFPAGKSGVAVSLDGHDTPLVIPLQTGLSLRPQKQRPLSERGY